ncbi:MAG: DEAD/DEAH box helicase [Dehalococcoidia bacterium]|nr:DEAD/DEAH box helicase [Dehalococcoidia bacterium]
MNTEAILERIQAQPWYHGQIVHRQAIPSREARYGQPRRPLHAALAQYMATLGMPALYSHQAEAMDALDEGRNVIVATATASGKSMCYHAPVLESLLTERGARALYIFPTKALAQDQLRKLQELGGVLPGGIRAVTYDGDTPGEERAMARRSAQVVLTNPDMLHLGILPNHRAWRQFFSKLRYVVFDEAHVYRGVFGSHVANVIRRLRRICALAGASPRFVLCSATIANPQEHAEQLTGLPFEAVTEDGSPFGGKDFVLWNPPLIDEAKTNRRSPNSEATLAFAELVRQEVRTIAFSRTRKLAELVYMYTRDRLREEDVSLAGRIKPYRAGYLAEDRRAIERGLFNGELTGVSATSALELGIDVGDLDATVLNGYPGTIASAWQQAGRSGRRGERSLSVMIAASNPLDQYLMRHPEAFFGKAQEHALISPSNPHILKPHLLCAAYEWPLTRLDLPLFSEEMTPLLAELADAGLLHENRERWFPTTGVTYPAEEVNIRSTTADVFQIVEEGSGTLLETIDGAVAYSQAHPGAVYLHQGEPYLITALDLEARVAWARRHGEPYYTVDKTTTDIRIVQESSHKFMRGTKVSLGKVQLSTQVVGFRRKRQFTEEMLGEEPLDLPVQSYETVALWWDIPEEALEEMERRKLDVAGGLHAAEHAAIGMLPFFAMCDRGDIGGVSTPLHPDTGKPQVFIYDGHPGGIGIAEKGYDVIEWLWDATLKTLGECECSEGCPSCVQSPKCGNNNEPLDKEAAAVLLRSLLGRRGAA